MLDTLATILTNGSTIASVNVRAESLTILTGDAEYAVTCTLRGDVRLHGETFGPVTVSAMRHGAERVAQDILAALHYAG